MMRKKLWILSFLLCMAGASMVGCSKTEGANQTENVSPAIDLVTPVPEESDKTDASKDGEDSTDTMNDADKKVPETTDSANPEREAEPNTELNAENNLPESTGNNESEKNSIPVMTDAEMLTADKNGEVIKLSAGGLTLKPYYTESTDSGSLMISTNADDVEYAEVLFNENMRCELYLGNPTTYEVTAKEASISDIAAQDSVYIWGEYEGGILKADKIIIFRLI